MVPELQDKSVSHSVNEIEPSIPSDSGYTESVILDRETWISTKVSVIIDLVELSLFYGLTKDASLATLQVIACS